MDQPAAVKNDRAKLASSLRSQEHELAIAVRAHKLNLWLLAGTLLLILFPVLPIRIHWGVPLVLVFMVIPLAGVVGFCRVRLAETRSRLVRDTGTLYCLGCWYPRDETQEPEFLCSECGKRWSTSAVRFYLAQRIDMTNRKPEPIKALQG